MSLKIKIDKQKSNFTVITTVLEVLKGHIAAIESNRVFTGLSLTEITVGYNKTAKMFGKHPFYGSYIQRHAKKGDFFEETETGRYRLRQEMLENITLGELQQIKDSIIEYWIALAKQKEASLQEFSKVKALPAVEMAQRLALINSYLSPQAGKTGQNFEIMSFAILSVYFSCLGFSLKRFSTTFANDGGMDFICGEGIYQVTARPTKDKIESDLAKLPGAKRIIVGPQIPTLIFEQLGEDILEFIELKDLKEHFLSWLYERDKRRGYAYHTDGIIEVAIREMLRE